jgi:hypothetical protein
MMTAFFFPLLGNQGAPNAGIERRRANSHKQTGAKRHERHTIPPSARMTCWAAVKVEMFPFEALVNNYGRLCHDRIYSSHFRHHQIARRDISYMSRNHLNVY